MPDPVDTVLRTVAVMAAILLASLLFASARQRPAALPGAIFCLAVAAFFVTSAPGGGAGLGGWGYLLTALCVTKAVWFWLFARALFNDDARLGKSQLAIVAAVAVAGTWQQTVFLANFRAGTANGWEILAGYGFEATLLLFVLLGVREAWRGLAVDLVERRRRLRLGFMLATGAYLTAALGVQSYNLLQGVSTPPLAAWANMTLVAAACLTAAWFLVRPRNESWLDPARTAATVALTRAESAALERLEAALESDRVFLQEGLTIGALAEHLGTREHVLRKVINRGMGYRNFNDFLHAQRIRQACDELARPEQARLPVLTIAMNVGYGSIGAFNRAFKARIGMTPTEYRRNTAGGASQTL